MRSELQKKEFSLVINNPRERTKKSLPQNFTTMLAEIIEEFEKFMMPKLSIDQFKSQGRIKLVEKIIPCVNKSLPIDFVMLGLPFKSTNTRDKVLGNTPDLGEELMIKNFKRFEESISSVYKPGVKVNIASDGLIFNQLLGVEEKVVYHYKEVSEQIISDFKSPVEILDLHNFYKGSLSDIREKLVSQFGVSEQRIESLILTDPDVNMLYKGMMIFMEEEQAMLEFPSKNQRVKSAKNLARKMMMINEAYSNLIKNEFKNSVRLSMHKSVNNGNKYSFQLIEGRPENIWASPWHCTIVMDPTEGPVTMHKKDAELLNYELVTKDNKPYFYIKNK